MTSLDHGDVAAVVAAMDDETARGVLVEITSNLPTLIFDPVERQRARATLAAVSGWL